MMSISSKPARPRPHSRAGLTPPSSGGTLHTRSKLAQWLTPRAILTVALGLILAYLVLPPLFIMVWKSFVGGLGLSGSWSFSGYAVVADTDLGLAFRDTFEFAIGSTVLALVLGTMLAWAVARTNAPLRKLGFGTAAIGLAVPGISSVIGWTLLFGNGHGQGDRALNSLLGSGASINIETMLGMIFVEGLLSTPIVFFLMVGPLRNFDSALEEVAEVFGARRWSVLRRITLPLLVPPLMSGALLVLIRAVQGFEVPLFIGVPAHAHVFTTDLYTTLRSALIPNYSAAGAYGTILLTVLLVLVGLETRLTRDSRKFAVVTGKSNVRSPRRSSGAMRYLPTALILALLLCFLIPVLYLMYASFEPNLSGWSSFGHLTITNYSALFGSPDFIRAVTDTLIVAGVAAIVVVIVSMLAAWVSARSASVGSWIVTLLANMPLVVPGVVFGFGILLFYLYSPVTLMGTLPGISLAFIALYVPYGMRTMRPAIIGISTELEESARVFGAREGSVVRRVLMPLIAPSAMGTGLFVFFTAFRELAAAALIVTAATPLLSTNLLDAFVNGDLNLVGALGTFIVAVTVIVGGGFGLLIGVYRRIGRTNQRADQVS